MKFPIYFSFDKKIIYIIINCISIFFIFRFDKYTIAFIHDLTLLFSIIISIICLLIRNKYLSKHHNKENFENIEIIRPGYKQYLSIIILYLLFNIIPLLNGIKINKEIRIYSSFSNITFIGIIIIGLNNKSIYRHQLLSVIILCMVIFFYPNLYEEFNKIHIYPFIFNCFYSFLYYYFRGVLRAFLKFNMESLYISPFFISAIDVSFNILKNLLVYGYYYFIANQNKKNLYFKKMFYNKLQNLEVYPFILYFIFNVIFPIFDILICYFYSPYHQSLTDILGHFLKSILIGNNSNSSIINSIIGIINIFFSGVIAEVIILYFCDLHINTKKEIIERANSNAIEEILNSSENYSDDNIIDLVIINEKK